MPSKLLRERIAKKPGLRLSRRAQQTAEQPISYLMAQAVVNPDLISLAAGLVDHDSLPVDETLAAVTELAGDRDAARRALQYGTTQGTLRLRELVVEHLERVEGLSAREMGFDADQVVITTGSQQLLQLVSDVLLDPGDIVLVGAPDYFVYLGTLHSIGARAVGVAMDEHGLVPEALAETLEDLDRAGELDRVKLLYCVSYYQNPTGVTLADERRPAILEIVEKWSKAGRILVLEDAAYRELHYGAPGPHSIRSYDRRGDTVILTQTFSKPLAPGFKTGYSVLPRDLVGPVLRQKGNHDFGSSNFNQHLLANIMASGQYDRHVAHLRDVYRTKLTVTLESLEAEFSRWSVPAHWTRPGGGLDVWLVLPETVDTTREGDLFRRCIDKGVLYVPGEYCFPAEQVARRSDALGGPDHTLRLCFGVLPPERLREGVSRLAAATAEALGSAH